MSNLKIALVHDYLKEYGGAERVLEAMHEVWPEAPIFTAFVDFDGLGPHAERIREWDIRTSWVQKVWPVKKLHSPLRFLTPWVWRYFDFSEFDIVITSSAWYIPRGIVTKGKTVHICYMHTPPRHLYGYETASDWKKYWPVRVYGEVINHFLRMYDYETAQNVDYFIANSNETKRRIEKFYRRDAEVIYPPVEVTARHSVSFLEDVRQNEYSKGKNNQTASLGENSDMNDLVKKSNSTEFSTPLERTHSCLAVTGRKDYYLCVSRLARAKHIDLAIRACQELGEPLVIVGKGIELPALKSKVKSQKSKVVFMGEVSDEQLHRIYEGAKALIFPAEDEEFGIVPVEAMAHGVPVIAYRSGGVVETVSEGKTGVFFDKLTVDLLIKAIKQLNNRTMNKEEIIAHSKKFSKERFQAQIKNYVSSILPAYA